MLRRCRGDHIDRITGRGFGHQLRGERPAGLLTEFRQLEAVMSQRVGGQNTGAAAVGYHAHAVAAHARHVAEGGCQEVGLIDALGADYPALSDERIGNLVISGQTAGMAAGRGGARAGAAGFK